MATELVSFYPNMQPQIPDLRPPPANSPETTMITNPPNSPANPLARSQESRTFPENLHWKAKGNCEILYHKDSQAGPEVWS